MRLAICVFIHVYFVAFMCSILELSFIQLCLLWLGKFGLVMYINKRNEFRVISFNYAGHACSWFWSTCFCTFSRWAQENTESGFYRLNYTSLYCTRDVQKFHVQIFEQPNIQLFSLPLSSFHCYACYITFLSYLHFKFIVYHNSQGLLVLVLYKVLEFIFTIKNVITDRVVRVVKL